MKLCLICMLPNEDAAPSCPACGEGSFGPSKTVSPTAPSADASAIVEGDKLSADVAAEKAADAKDDEEAALMAELEAEEAAKDAPAESSTPSRKRR